MKKRTLEKKKRTLLLLNLAIDNNRIDDIKKIVSAPSWNIDISREFVDMDFIHAKGINSGVNYVKGFRKRYSLIWGKIIEYIFAIILKDTKIIDDKYVKKVLLSKNGATSIASNKLYDAAEENENEITKLSKIIHKQTNKHITAGIIERTKYNAKLQKLIESDMLYPNYFDIKQKPSLGNFKSGSKVHSTFLYDKVKYIMQVLSQSIEFEKEFNKLSKDYFNMLLRTNLIDRISCFDDIIRALFFVIGDNFDSSQYVKYKYPFVKTGNKELDAFIEESHIMECHIMHDFVSLCNIYSILIKTSSSIEINQKYADVGYQVFKKYTKDMVNPYVFEKQKVKI